MGAINGKIMIDKFVELQPPAENFNKEDEMMGMHIDGIMHSLALILEKLDLDDEIIAEILSQVGAPRAMMGISVAFFPSLHVRLGTNNQRHHDR